jgi:integrase/recombinase XerC
VWTDREWHDATAGFLADLTARGYRPATVRVYRIAVGWFGARRAACGSGAGALSVLPAHLAPASRALFLTALRAFDAYCVRAELKDAAEIEREARVRVDVQAARPLSDDELAALRAALKKMHSWRLRLLFALMHEAGLRIGEALALRVSDLCDDAGNEGLRIRRTKGREDRFVPLTAGSPLLRLLRMGRGKLPDAYWLYPKSAPLRPWSYSAARAEWRHLERRAGVKATPHRIRHTRATALYRGGMGLYELKRFLGHARTDTTARYIGADDARIRAELTRVEGRK